VPNSLVHDDVWALLRDDAGSIWVGSTGGLSYRLFDSGVVSTVLGATLRPQSPSGSDIAAILPSRDGSIWLGFLTGGADRIDPVLGRVETLVPDHGQPETALPQDALFALAEDADGRSYFATRRGLYVRDDHTSPLRLVQIPGRDRHTSVTALSFEKGVLWIGGEDDGVWGLVPGRGKDAGTLVLGPADNIHLPDPGIQVMRRGAGDDLWVGTRNGLNLINLSGRTLEHVAAAPRDPMGLPGRFVSCLLFDRQGRLWVGTFGGGLAVMTGRNAQGQPRFRRLGTAEGLPHVNVDSLQMDGAGMIWAGTDDGMALIDPVAVTVRPVRRADGDRKSVV
jgi:ligand-binding sensor domain-containing protein